MSYALAPVPSFRTVKRSKGKLCPVLYANNLCARSATPHQM